MHPVHLNGPEYGIENYAAEFIHFSNKNPGEYDTDYVYNGWSALQRLVRDGWQTVKLPLRWERMQPRLHGPLNYTEVGRTQRFLDQAHTAGLGVISDVHNYGLYYQHDPATNLGRRLSLGDPALPYSAFADLWARLAARFGDHPATVAYAIMAEPQDCGGMSVTMWHKASQAAVDAIRAYDMRSEIHVAGFAWSQMANWQRRNGARWWITDPANNSRAEAHHYWDLDGSGEYARAYAAELADAERDFQAGAYPDALHAKVFTELETWLAWLDRNQVRGIVGEVGWPGSVDAQRWAALGQAYLHRATQENLPVVAWFAGEWAWSGDDLRLYEGGSELGDKRNQVPTWNQFRDGPRNDSKMSQQ